MRWLIALSLLGGTVVEASADRMPITIPARKPGAPNVPALEAYVFQPDPYRAGIPPRGLVAAQVGRYLAVMIDRATPLAALLPAETVATFYDASEVARPFLAMLDKQEKTALDRRRSIVLARTVAAVGGEKDVAAAAAYFVDLCGRADSLQELEELVQLFAALPAATDPKPLQDRIAARIAALGPKPDYSTEIEVKKLRGDVTMKLDGVVLAKAAQTKVLAIAERPARLRALIELYLGIDATRWDLRPWAAARLRRETWAERPAENLVRVDKPAHIKSVVKALRDALPAIAKQEPDEREFMQVRALRAIAFFGGALSAAEKKVATNSGTQADILANEGFMIPAKRR